MTRVRVDRVDRERQFRWKFGRPLPRVLRVLRGVLVCLVFHLVVPATVVADQGQVRELLVDWANTPEEHAASALYYEGRAREARQEVSRHVEMGARYATGDMKNRLDQGTHCERIASLHRQLAKEYEALAQNHRQESERREGDTSDPTQ